MAKATKINKAKKIYKLSNVQIDYPNITKRSRFSNIDAPTYDLVALIPYSKELMRDPKSNCYRIMSAYREILKVSNIDGRDIKEDRNPIKDGSKKANYDGYIYLRPRSSIRPTVFNDKAELLQDERLEYVGDFKFQSGDFVSIVIMFWVYDNEYGFGVSVNLKAVQFIKRGTNFNDFTAGYTNDDWLHMLQSEDDVVDQIGMNGTQIKQKQVNNNTGKLSYSKDEKKSKDIPVYDSEDGQYEPAFEPGMDADEEGEEEDGMPF